MIRPITDTVCRQPAPTVTASRDYDFTYGTTTRLPAGVAVPVTRDAARAANGDRNVTVDGLDCNHIVCPKCRSVVECSAEGVRHSCGCAA